MRKRNSDFLFLILTLLCSTGAIPKGLAQQVTFTAQVSQQRVVENGVFDIQFELSNAHGSNFQPPSFGDFKVVGGPSRGSSTTIINGAMSSSESYSYSLLATTPGRYTIGSASIVAGRKKLTTNPVVVEVVKGRDLVQPGGAPDDVGNILLRAEIEDKNFYPGQQITLNYRLFFTQNIQSIDILSEDDYDGFFVQNFAEFSKQPTIEKINGVDYTSRIIKSIALFPHQSGEYEIDPLVMSIGINMPFPGVQGFFTMRRSRDVRVASEPMTIHVLPLPGDAPLTFHGAVGKYQMKTYASQRELTTDEALAFQIEMHGDGDSKRWDPPTPAVDTSFEAYEPKIEEDLLSESGGRIDHRRSLAYQLLPKHPGRFKVYVPFTYFDPEARRYVTISSDTLTVVVTQGTGSHLARVDENPETPLDIVPIGNTIFADRFWTSWPHLFLFGLLMTGSCWAYLFAAKKKKEERISPAEKIRSAAGRKAMAQLDELIVDSSNLESKIFFEKATEIYNRFLCERIVIPPSQLDESRLPKFLQKAGVETDLAEQAVHLFTLCLPVRYGGAPAGFTREEMVVACKDIIRNL